MSSIFSINRSKRKDSFGDFFVATAAAAKSVFIFGKFHFRNLNFENCKENRGILFANFRDVQIVESVSANLCVTSGHVRESVGEQANKQAKELLVTVCCVLKERASVWQENNFLLLVKREL